MKCFRNVVLRRSLWVLAVLAAGTSAWAALDWRNIEAGTAIESALYRLMPMPVRSVLGLRPPREAVPLLSDLIKQHPTAELYSIRALNEEAALDFGAAEADWKKYADSAPDHRIKAQFALADFYHRRLRPNDEIAVLRSIGNTSLPPDEKLSPVAQQSSWIALERADKVAEENAFDPKVFELNYSAWIARYPDQRTVYARYFQFLLDSKSFKEAEKLITQYQKAFTNDEVFPVKASALLAYKKGSVEQGLAIYDGKFQPLWPRELIDSYFDLLKQTHSTRRFLDDARAALERNPDDIKAAARIYYYYQHQGNSEAARQTLLEYRTKKEKRNGRWNSDELIVLARLSEGLRDFPEAARYYYALYSEKDSPDSPRIALAGLTRILLEAPEQNIRFGTRDLSMYRDIGTMDSGPGFLNGVLSLLLNSTGPAYAYSEEEQRAVPYFHRAAAAELLRRFDASFPSVPERPDLHARLIETYANYGESEVVIRDGKDFLTSFPSAPQRQQVALLMADAYARTNRSADELALYDSLLAELARRAEGVPLGLSGGSPSAGIEAPENGSASTDEAEGDAEASAGQPRHNRAFAISETNSPDTPSGARSNDYSRILERYLSRLVSMDRLPDALAVLRKEIDRNPNDPGLYERLAQFLEQNRLGAQQEQVYQAAIQRFPDHSWYHKLARFYLRERRREEFAKLSEQVIGVFSGSDIESYFSDVSVPREYSSRLNEYAHKRFPHDLQFVRNLIAINGPTSGQTEQLLREHWWEAEDLRNRFFELLSRTGRLDAELAALNTQEASAKNADWNTLAQKNPVAVRFVGEADFWRSHFEYAAPAMQALAQQFPADSELGHRASAVFRSLAAFDPHDTEIAVAIEDNLAKAAPTDREQLAHVGDVFADRELFARAAPYWDRMAQIRPGEAQAYLDAATVYWDYYDYDSALRLLNQGRVKLRDPALYSYETGAIYEGLHDYPHAIAEYLKGALKDKEGSRSRNRLLDLTRRKTLRDEVDRATTSLGTGTSPSIDEVMLRIAVLENENRTKEIAPFLTSISTRATSLELLEWLEETGRARSIEQVQQAAIERQAELSTDPVRRLEFRYSLVTLYEARKDLNAAQRNIEVLYRENPKIAGVVRATVDFYWRNKQQSKATEVLLQAADSAYPSLSVQYRFEAARKATESSEYELARRLLTQLLSASPYNDEYMAAMADTYSRAGDNQGLKDFYVGKLGELQKAQLPPDTRMRQVATLRRGLIPALTRLKDTSGAVDQYIELINRLPDDDALITEAALYAQQQARQSQLLQYYANTIKQSPRDYRWPMVLAKIQTQLEDYPAAIASFAQASKIRPDRIDLRVARAQLLERLMQFDDAAAEYQKLYDLTYRDPRWMEALAGIRARQQDTKNTVVSLQLAFVEGRPEKPQNYFQVARHLASWGMLPEAREYAQKGVDVAGRDLLAVPDYHDGAALYVDILTRIRQQETAYERLRTAVADADSVMARATVAADQVAKNGIASVTDSQWRQSAIAARRENARTGMTHAMRAIGSAVAQYFTPEERAAFESSLQRKASGASAAELRSTFIPAAESANLAAIEGRWIGKVLLDSRSNNEWQLKSRLIDLQSRRLAYRELGEQLEAYAGVLRPESGRDAVLRDAAQAYRAGGLDELEANALAKLDYTNNPNVQQRYFALLLRMRPEQLDALAKGGNLLADAATRYAIVHGDSKFAQRLVETRGSSLSPLWTNSYSALTGLYFADRSAITKAHFLNALGDETIGERVSKPADRTQQLVGDIWFYYGSRYGEWLGSFGGGDAEDYLPAVLESSPASASGYVSVAEYYAEAGKLDRAVQDYRHALEIAPARPDIHDRIALLYFRQKKSADAIAEWKIALEGLRDQVNMRSVPPSFWSNLGYVLDHVGNRHLIAEVRPEADSVLRTYVRHNGSYQVDELLHQAYRATGDPQPGVEWLLDLASVAPEPKQVLTSIAEAEWVPDSARGPIYERIIAQLEDSLRASQGLSRGYTEQELRQWQLRYARHFIELKQYDRGLSILEVMSKLQQPSANELELRFRCAVARNDLHAILERYRAVPEEAPPLEVIRQAAQALKGPELKAASRELMEFVFAQEINSHQLNAANMLGLAEIRLQDGDTPGAIELLRRLTLVVGQPFENLDAAATVLAKNGHHAEATEFLAQLLKATPWDASSRLRLAQEQIAAGLDRDDASAAARRVATDPQAAYSDRVLASKLLAGSNAVDLGSTELNVLASGMNSEAADKPYFTAARIANAASATSPEVRERILRNALNDSPQELEARVPLFEAFAASGKTQLAISTIEPMLNRGLLGYGSVREEQTDEETLASSEAAPEGDNAVPTIPATKHPTNALTATERVRLATSVAECYGKLSNFTEAMRYYSIARGLTDDKAAKAAFDQKIRRIQSTIRRLANNERRAPSIHEDLNQDHVVRPKLMAALQPSVKVTKGDRTK